MWREYSDSKVVVIPAVGDQAGLHGEPGFLDQDAVLSIACHPTLSMIASGGSSTEGDAGHSSSGGRGGDEVQVAEY